MTLERLKQEVQEGVMVVSPIIVPCAFCNQPATSTVRLFLELPAPFADEEYENKESDDDQHVVEHRSHDHEEEEEPFHPQEDQTNQEEVDQETEIDDTVDHRKDEKDKPLNPEEGDQTNHDDGVDPVPQEHENNEDANNARHLVIRFLKRRIRQLQHTVLSQSRQLVMQEKQVWDKLQKITLRTQEFMAATEKRMTAMQQRELKHQGLLTSSMAYLDNFELIHDMLWSKMERLMILQPPSSVPPSADGNTNSPITAPTTTTLLGNFHKDMLGRTEYLFSASERQTIRILMEKKAVLHQQRKDIQKEVEAIRVGPAARYFPTLLELRPQQEQDKNNNDE
jgi:hypothetical protein